MKANCKICGNTFDSSHFSSPVQKVMTDRCICFTCYHWLQQHELDVNGENGHARNYAIIDRTHYVLCPHTDMNWPKGHGGHKFYIQFNDGRVEMCDNMWCQGDIPKEFDEMMPDNAKFITEEEYKNQLSKNDSKDSI